MRATLAAVSRDMAQPSPGGSPLTGPMTSSISGNGTNPAQNTQTAPAAPQTPAGSNQVSWYNNSLYQPVSYSPAAYYGYNSGYYYPAQSYYGYQAPSYWYGR